jgi:hypothetical protein
MDRSQGDPASVPVKNRIGMADYEGLLPTIRERQQENAEAARP